MTLTAQEVLKQALSLPTDDQQFIVNRMLDHLEPEGEFDILNDPDLRAELDRRIASVGDGTAKLLTHDAVFSEIQANRKVKRDLTRPVASGD